MQDEIIDLINNGEFGDAFEELRVLGLMEGATSLIKLENSYIQNIKDVDFVDRLKAAVRQIFRNQATATKKKTIQEPSPITEVLQPTPTLLSTKALDIVPIPETYFSGRQAELAELKAIFEAHNFISIVGTGGIGKSQLVSKYLEEAQIPEEKIYWIQCEPTTSLDSIMTKIGFGELLRVENQTDKDKISNVIYRLNREKRYLFLEDYHDIQQKELIESFLGSSQGKLKDSKIVLISRDNVQNFLLKPKKLTIKGLKEEDLRNLIDELRTFFEEDIPFDNTELLNLAQKLEGHPLAIYLSLDLLKSGFSMQEIEKEIINRGHEKTVSSKEETISERLLNAIFTRKDASPEERQFIKKFSVFRGIVSEQIIDLVLEVKSWSIATKLKEKNILKVTPKEGVRHYSLHPLVREFCYKQFFFDQTGREQALQLHSKIAQYFIKGRSSLISILNEEKINYHLIRAQEWEQIYTDIEVLGDDMIAQGHFDHLDKIINQLENSNQPTPLIVKAFKGKVLYKKGEIKEATRLFLQVENSTDLKTKILGILGSGEIFHSRGNIQEADQRFQLAVSLLENKKDTFPLEYIMVLLSIGSSQNAKGNYDESLNTYLEVKNLAQKNGFQSEFATALNNIGLICHGRKEFNKAITFYKKSLQIAIELGEKSNIGTSLSNIGGIYVQQEENEKAIETYQKSIAIFKTIGQESGLAVTLYGIGGIHLNKGEYDEAIETYQKSLKIFKKLKQQSYIASSLNNIGLSYLEKKEYSKASKYLHDCLEIYQALKAQAHIAASLINIGSLFLDQEKFTEALNYLLNSLLINRLLKIPHENILPFLLSIKQQLGVDNYKKAIETNLKKYEPELQALFKEELRAEILGLS
jgi:tetratricopeptide (TPR) repeat protein